jgi:molybdate transport system substrate-binding protein
VKRLVVAIIIVPLLATGCGRRRTIPAPGARPALNGAITVSVADELQPVCDALEHVFRARYPGVTVSDADDPANLSVTVGGEGVEFARVPLILIVPKGNPADIRDITDLATERVKAIAAVDLRPSAGVRDALKSAGILSACEPKLQFAKGSVEAAEMVSNRKADIALVPGTYLAAKKLGETEAGPAKGTELLGAVPEETFPGLSCRAQVLTQSEGANAFVDTLTSPEAQSVVRRAGLVPVKEPVAGAALHVYCGTGLRPPMEELAELYKREAGVEVDVSYAGSGCLLSQLTFARRGDLYVPGEIFYMDQAQKRGFLVEFKPIANMVPVIMVQKGNPKRIASLQDLAKPGLKVALGEPDAAAIGRETNALLDRAGLRKQVEKNCRMRAVNIAELGNVVKLKAVDAVIIWNANAVLWEDSTETIPIPAKYYQPARICMGILTFSENPSVARGLLELAASDRGRAIFEKHGYVIPSEQTGEAG